MSIRTSRARQRVPPVLAARVAATWGNECWLNFPDCTHESTTTDHITPWAAGGRTVPGNLRRACKHCNSLRGDRVLSGWGATIHAVIGPPQGGKSSWVAVHAQPGDIVLDMDAIATAMQAASPAHGVDHSDSRSLRKMASSAWYAAYRHAVRLGEPTGVWLVKTMPASPRSPRLLDEWVALGYDIHVCDPGKPTVTERQRRQPRPYAEAGIREWYRSGITQSSIDAKVERRQTRLHELGLVSLDKCPDRPSW